MSRESGDQPAQRTVAELLAQYGGKPADGRRRRHRRPDDDAGPDAPAPDVATTAPQAIIARIQSEAPEIDWDTAKRNGRSHAAAERNGSRDVPRRGPRPPDATGPPPARAGSGYHRGVPQPTQTPSAPATQAPLTPPFGPAQPPQGEQHSEPKQGPRPGSLAARLAGLGHVTVPPRGARGAPAAPVESPTHEFAAVAQPGKPEPGSALDLDKLDERAGAYDELEARATDSDEGADAEDPGDDRSPGQQWLAMAAQLALGVVGGAAVWLIFNWLWAEVAAVALIAAVVVIAGLVWIVRKMRRTEDLQTMVLAVLVGLVVTVSPAALLLLSR